MQSLEKLKPLALLWLRVVLGIIFFFLRPRKAVLRNGGFAQGISSLGFPCVFRLPLGDPRIVRRHAPGLRIIHARNSIASGHRNGDRAGARLDPSRGNLRSPRLRASSGPMWSFICTGGRGGLFSLDAFTFERAWHAATREIAALKCAKFLDGGDDVFGLRQDLVFELGLISAESVHRGDPPHRRVQIVEKFL